MLTIGVSGDLNVQVADIFADNNFGFDGKPSWSGQHGPYKVGSSQV
jgi:hypothetical protein